MGITHLGGTLVLDSHGLTSFAAHSPIVRAAAQGVLLRGGGIVVAASTLTEVLRGGARDAVLHRVLARIAIEPITGAVARRAGELLGRTGMTGHVHALDALVAAVALDSRPPVLLLTSDVDDLSRLTEESGRPKHLRVAVHHV